MAFTRIKRWFFTTRLKKANEHYKTDKVIGERGVIEREGKNPVEVIFYYPEKRENMPVFVQVHGGGWVGMDAVDDDAYCDRLSKELGAFVVNVNYKRLYEESFPYCQEEVADVVRWLKKNAEKLSIDPDRIVVSGGSAGGHITAGAAILLAHDGIKIAGQVIEVPFLDFTGTIPIDFPEGNKLYRLMFEVCPPKVPVDSELISPAARIKDETIEMLSPAVIIVCGRDPLHPQGEHYAALLKKHGKLHDIIKYERGYHGFGTEREDEKEEQDRLREECFEYKVNKTRELYKLSKQE